MEIFRGWYRKSLSQKGMVWHRVRVGCVGSSFTKEQMVRTVCGLVIPPSKCDFTLNPNGNIQRGKCMRCGNSTKGLTEIDRGLALVKNETPINTRNSAVTELKRLLKPRVYYLKIWDCEGVRITAKWESDVSISIYTEMEIITSRRKKRVFTIEQVQADLSRFKSAIDYLCDRTDALAMAAKRKKKLKGRLTEDESMEYFEELMCEAEK